MARKIPPKFLPLLLSLPLVLTGCVALFAAIRQKQWLHRLFIEVPEFIKPFNDAGLVTLVTIFRISAFVLAGVMVMCGVMGLLKRSPRGAKALRSGYVAVYIWATFYAIVAMLTIGLIHDNRIKIDGDVPGVEGLFYIKFDYLWPAVLLAGIAWALQTFGRGREARALYGESTLREDQDRAKAGGAGAGGLSTTGADSLGAGLPVLNYRATVPRLDDDPALKRTFNLSLAFHVVIIVILPLMFRGFGCALEYRLPGGGGGGGGGGAPVEQVIKAQVEKKTKKKKFIVNPNSSITFNFPKIDDSNVRDDVVTKTENQYQANSMAGKGKGKGLGKGSGSGSGFAGGDPNAVYRFLRLQHEGDAWDDGMGPGERADANFLDHIAAEHGAKTAATGEAVHIGDLKRFKKGLAPPVVYITGNGAIRGVTSTDEKTLRQYVLDGGMIWGDAGSPEFGQSFRALMARVFPDKALLDISNDDGIFQEPWLFAKGAPPLWHHDGDRAKGIKHNGRWCVFYFPGDMNDAWKTGHSGVSKSLADLSMKLGVNVFWYASVNYYEQFAPKQ